MKYDITFHPKWWHKNAGVDFSEPFFTDAKYRLECDVKMRKTLYEHFGKYGVGEKNPSARPILGTDLLAAGYLHSGMMGCNVQFSKHDSPQVICAKIPADDIEYFKLPKLKDNLSFQNLKRQVDFFKTKFGYVLPCVNLMGVQNIAMDLMGEELFLAYYTNPDQVQKLLRKITKFIIELGDFLWNLNSDCSGGVTAIVRKVCPNCYVTSNCSVEMISQQLYETFLLEFDKALASHFGLFGIHHCGGTMEHIVNAYARVGAKLIFAEVGAGSNVAAVRHALPHVFLNARYSPVALYRQTATEIEIQVENLFKSGQKMNRDAFSISCVGIDDQISDKAICCFLSACKAF